MTYSSIPQRITAQPVTAGQTTVPLREGQMFHGQIKQLYPGQMAEVQIGNQKLMAKLEVPMKAGDAYYFQVKSTEPELQLKIVSGPVQASEGQTKQLANLIDSMKLPNTQEIQDLLKHFMKNRIPVSRENLLAAESLLKSVPPALRTEALNAIQKVVELKLPLTQTNFNSLIAMETKEGLHPVLASLKTVLTEDLSIDPKVKASILDSLESASRATIATTIASQKAVLASAVLKLLDTTAPGEEKFQVLQMLKQVGILPPRTSLANLQSVLHSAVMELETPGVEQGIRQAQVARQPTETATVPLQVAKTDIPLPATPVLNSWQNVLKTADAARQGDVSQSINHLKSIIQNDPVLQQSFKTQFIGILDEIAKLPSGELRTSGLSEQLSQALVKVVAQQSLSAPVGSDVSVDISKLLRTDSGTSTAALFRTVEQSPLPVMKELIREVQVAVGQAVDGKVMKEAMQTIFRSLGVNYEAGLLNRDTDFARTSELLKPQLVALLQDSSVSSTVRDAAETVVARMNGPMLQSGDTAMNQQIIMQLPLDMLGKRIDATLEWNGRLKEDGKIDPDFARILFYLDLESIEKTVIDMQVQNRVVTVTVFNEDDRLKIIGAALQDKLREGLESADYRLSGVAFKNFEEEKRLLGAKRETKQDQQGVDFRI